MIYNLDCLGYLQSLPPGKQYRTIFMDPPDNVGLKYEGFTDKIDRYEEWLSAIVWHTMAHADVVWLSYNAKHLVELNYRVADVLAAFSGWKARTFIWRYTFGQHRYKDCGSGFRPILRLSSPDWVPDTSGIRVPSARQTKYNDKRAAGPKVPDDVWEFPRVCGTFKERRKWHPTQHPEALVKRALLMSGPGKVFDPFVGSGTTLRVCKQLGWECSGCEISPEYALFIAAENEDQVIGPEQFYARAA